MNRHIAVTILKQQRKTVMRVGKKLAQLTEELDQQIDDPELMAAVCSARIGLSEVERELLRGQTKAEDVKAWRVPT